MTRLPNVNLTSINGVATVIFAGPEVLSRRLLSITGGFRADVCPQDPQNPHYWHPLVFFYPSKPRGPKQVLGGGGGFIKATLTLLRTRIPYSRTASVHLRSCLASWLHRVCPEYCQLKLLLLCAYEPPKDEDDKKMLIPKGRTTFFDFFWGGVLKQLVVYRSTPRPATCQFFLAPGAAQSPRRVGPCRHLPADLTRRVIYMYIYVYIYICK